MPWFSSTLSIDAQVEQATNESIPFGETDLATSMEVTDLIRSKQVPAKDAMRSLKKRLVGTKNPNTQLATLHLIDTCVKNGGAHFIVEVATREFIDTLVSLVHEDKTNENVRDLTLDLIQAWALAFKDNFQLKYINTTYTHLKEDGYSFPAVGTGISSTLFDSSAPPEWEDSDACMICSNAFTMINRKHHCRNCGGVYCQTHSSKNIALPELGITEPVRVCDTCYDEIHHKNKSSKSKKHRRSKHQKDVSRARAQYESDDDEDLKKALALSLQESQGLSYTAPKPQPVVKSVVAAPTSNSNADDEDEEMKAAIAASLREFEQEKQRGQPNQVQQQQQQQQQPVQESGPYANLLPQSTYTPTTYTPTTYTQQQLPPQVQAHAPITQQEQQPLPPQLSNLISSQEEHDIVQFASKVEDLKRTPSHAIENPELNDLYRRAIPLTPKISSDMNTSFSKYDQLIDMNTKIDQVMRMYNNLLDRRIERESQQRQQQQQQQQQQYAPQLSYANTGYGYTQYQQTSPQLTQQQQQQQQQQRIPSHPVYHEHQHQSPVQQQQLPVQPQYVHQQPQPQPQPQPQQQESSPYPSNPYPVTADITGQSAASAPVPQVPQLEQSNYQPPQDPFQDAHALNEEEEQSQEQAEEEEDEFTAPPSQSQVLSQPSSPVEHQVPLTNNGTGSYPPQSYVPAPQQQQQQHYQPQQAYPQSYPGQQQQQKITDITFPTVPMNKPPQTQVSPVVEAPVVKEEAQLIEL